MVIEVLLLFLQSSLLVALVLAMSLFEPTESLLYRCPLTQNIPNLILMPLIGLDFCLLELVFFILGRISPE